MPYDPKGTLDVPLGTTPATLRDPSLLHGQSWSRWTGALFQGPPKAADVMQGALQNCSLLSAINSILVKPDGPSVIQSIVKDNHDHVIFRLSKNGVRGFYKVTRTLPKEDFYTFGRPVFFKGNPRHSLGSAKWVRLFEKALIGLHIPEGYSQYYDSRGNGGSDPAALMASLLGGTEKKAHSIRPGSEDLDIFRKLIAYSTSRAKTPYYRSGAERSAEVKGFGKEAAERLRQRQLDNALLRKQKLAKEQAKRDEDDKIEKELIKQLTEALKISKEQLEQWKNWNDVRVNGELQKTLDPPYSTRFDEVLNTAPSHMTFKYPLLRWYSTHLPVPGEVGTKIYSTAQMDLFESMERGLKAQRIITVETKANLFSSRLGLHPRHWYAVIDVKTEGWRRSIQVRNPHGGAAADSWLELTDFFLNFEQHFYEAQPVGRPVVSTVPLGHRRGAVFGVALKPR